jgi:N-hydroxyarylamine O-acetyltransferase
MAARAGEAGRRYTILNGDFKIREADGQARGVAIETPAHLQGLLREHFGLHFPPDTRFGTGDVPWPT